jgi:hypothetical protein
MPEAERGQWDPLPGPPHSGWEQTTILAAGLSPALIPAVQAAWRAANKGRLLTVTRIDGLPHKGFERDGNLARCQAGTWAEVSGYTLDYGVEGLTWNSVRHGHYAHSAGATWDGVRRDTHSMESFRSCE